MAQRTHSHAGRTPLTPVGTEEYNSPLGDATARIYWDLGTLGLGASGDIAVGFGRTSDGTETATSTSVNDNNPAPATTGITVAGRIAIPTDVGTGGLDYIIPRTTNKVASIKIAPGRLPRAWYGGAATSPTTEVALGASTNALPANQMVNFVAAFQTGAGTGKEYARFWNDAGTTYYQSSTATGQLGTGNIVSVTIGKGTATTGFIVTDSVVIENAYNESLLPLPTAAVVAEDNVTWRVIDLTGSTGVTSLSNATASPTVTGLTIDGLRIRFVENPARTTSVTVTYTVNTASGSTARTTVVPPPTGGTPPRHGGEFVYRGGQLIPFDGAPAWTGATGTITLGAPGVPSVEPAWSDDFTILDVATSTTTATAKWLPVDTWQNIDRGYRDFAGTSWNLNPNETLAGAKRSAFTVGPDGLTIKAIRTPEAWKTDIVASMTAQGQSPYVAPAWSGGVLITNKIVKRFRYGYIAVKAQLPTPGRGMFPALWLYAADGSNNPEGKGAAEIDLFEVFGHPAGTPWSITTHYRDNTNTVVRPSVDVTTQATDTTGWHVYGVDWQPTYLRFYKDGTQVAELTGDNAAWFNTDMALRLNYAMDASWFTTPSDTSTPDELPMNIRWVAQWPSLT